MKARFRSRRELATVAAALLLPIPLLVAAGLVLPLPSGVERGVVSLLPGFGAGDNPGKDPGTDKPAAGVLSEGGNAATRAAGNGAADGDGNSAGDMQPRDELRPPGSGEPNPPAAPGSPGASGGPGSPGSPGGQTDPGGNDETGPAPVADEEIATGISVDQNGLELDVSGSPGSAGADVDLSKNDGISISLDASDDDTSAETTVYGPVPTIPLRTLP
jgi:hypothetical protein